MRIEGWEKLLAQHIEEARKTAFQWGTHDCVMWCASWIKKCTGNDFAKGIVGTYDTEEGANEYLRANGYETVESVADKHLFSVPMALAGRGDILLRPDYLLGICTGVNGDFITQKGVTEYRTLKCLKAWRVD